MTDSQIFLKHLSDLFTFCIDNYIIDEEEAKENFPVFCDKYDDFDETIEVEYEYNSNLVDPSPLKALKTAYVIKENVETPLLNIIVDELIIITFDDVSTL